MPQFYKKLPAKKDPQNKIRWSFPLMISRNNSDFDDFSGSFLPALLLLKDFRCKLNPKCGFLARFTRVNSSGNVLYCQFQCFIRISAHIHNIQISFWVSAPVVLLLMIRTFSIALIFYIPSSSINLSRLAFSSSLSTSAPRLLKPFGVNPNSRQYASAN